MGRKAYWVSLRQPGCRNTELVFKAPAFFSRFFCLCGPGALVLQQQYYRDATIVAFLLT